MSPGMGRRLTGFRRINTGQSMSLLNCCAVAIPLSVSWPSGYFGFRAFNRWNGPGVGIRCVKRGTELGHTPADN
jgi:hypothetical protein